MILKAKVGVFVFGNFAIDIDARKIDEYLTIGIVVPQIQSYDIVNFRYYEKDDKIFMSKYIRINYENRTDEIHFDSSEKCDAFVEELENCIKEVWSNPNIFIRKV